ncbi:MAG: phospholipase C [Thiobacillaceae bacterium]
MMQIDRHFRLVAATATALAMLVSTPTRAVGPPTSTPIKHLVVIYQENVSFDHYFGTYPTAANPTGEPAFHMRPNTPTVNGLTQALLEYNPNATAPFRLPRSRAARCDQDHDYTDEQRAMDHGMMDRFVETLGNGPGKSGNIVCDKKDVMGYFDGNTVTALWNFAQHFSMSDNSFGTGFGPSTPGALNLISANTGNAVDVKTKEVTFDATQNRYTVIGDAQPAYDDCTTRDSVGVLGRNVGDLLTARKITWGFFQGGFNPTVTYNPNQPGSRAVCNAHHTGSDGQMVKDYIPHHQPFQYYKSTSNPHHLPPLSAKIIGHNEDQANHQYDLSAFWDAIQAKNLPAVSFLKAPAYQDGHPRYSDPLAEQEFLVDTINRLQALPAWKDMAIIIAYDDSDGWYDHVMPPIVSRSTTAGDALTAPGACGSAEPGAIQGRCGYGPRLPLLVVSPWAKSNFVDHSTTDQSSVLRFIEDNWYLERIGGGSLDARAGSLENLFDFHHIQLRQLFMDPATGVITTLRGN